MSLDDPVALYFTYQFSDEKRNQLISELTSHTMSIESHPYDPSQADLSPLRLFQDIGGVSPDGHQHFIVADERTHNELEGSQTTVVVVGVWSTDPEYELDLYRGPPLPHSEPERLARLRELAEIRAVSDVADTAQWGGIEEWAWEDNAEQKGLEAKLWQIKPLRANIAGAKYASEVYDMEDIKDSYLGFLQEAVGTGGVFQK